MSCRNVHTRAKGTVADWCRNGHVHAFRIGRLHGARRSVNVAWREHAARDTTCQVGASRKRTAVIAHDPMGR